MIILRLTPPPPHPLKNVYVEESFEESSESLDSELVSSSHELGDSSSSTASLPLRFLRAWVRTRSINSALLLILRPFCFKYIFSSLLVSAFTSFSIVQEISGRVFLSLTLFFGFCIEELKVLYITFTCRLVHVVLGTYTSCKDLSSEEGNFPLLNNFFIWTLGRNLSMWSPVDVALVNGKYFLGEVASRVGTGERWTGTPLVQPSLRHPSHVGVQENLMYSRKYCPLQTWSSFNFWNFSNKAFPHIDLFVCKEDLFHLISHLTKKNNICFSWGYLVTEMRKLCFPWPGSSLVLEQNMVICQCLVDQLFAEAKGFGK